MTGWSTGRKEWRSGDWIARLKDARFSKIETSVLSDCTYLAKKTKAREENGINLPFGVDFKVFRAIGVHIVELVLVIDTRLDLMHHRVVQGIRNRRHWRQRVTQWHTALHPCQSCSSQLCSMRVQVTRHVVRTWGRMRQLSMVLTLVRPAGLMGVLVHFTTCNLT